LQGDAAQQSGEEAAHLPNRTRAGANLKRSREFLNITSSTTSQQSPVTAQTPCSDAGTKSRQLFAALVAAYEEKKPQLPNYCWALTNYHGASAF
jgi:hypothetical protein